MGYTNFKSSERMISLVLIFEPLTERAGESSLPIDFLSLVLGAPWSSFIVLRTVMVCEAEVNFDFSALGGKLLLS